MLRDLYCSECGATYLDIDVPSGETSLEMWCAPCSARRVLQSVCNGGLGHRYRMNDWPSDPEFYRGQVKALDVTSKDSSGDDVRRYHSGTREIGEPMHAADKYHNGTDARELKRDRIVHDGRRKRGRLPLLFDMRGKGIQNG